MLFILPLVEVVDRFGIESRFGACTWLGWTSSEALVLSVPIISAYIPTIIIFGCYSAIFVYLRASDPRMALHTQQVAPVTNASAKTKSSRDFVLVQNTVDQKMRAINFGQVRGGNWVKIRMDKESHLGENGLRVGDNIVVYFGPTEKSKPGYYSTIVRGVYDDKKTCDEALKALRASKRKSAGPVIETERTERLRGVSQFQTDEDLADGHVTEIFALTDPINKAFFKQKMNNNMASVKSRFV
ncbi:hypothetical protein RvY_11876 [Ramazzottius varieornatus]|uniref:Uncharacterized protein n=1 Tax=Ramazzottius varieornatus TaxID=947166 RepID=A0A1D1VHI9_RAMVA|nr:hypothetical protein RvY_11876 [Ramazzottius varieornatus]